MDIDVQQQWRELEETYSQMADEELESLASQAYELTDLAKQALERQITTRGLKIALTTEPPPCDDRDVESHGDLDPAELELVACNQVWNEEEARTTKAALDSAGLPSYIGPDLCERVDEFQGSYDGGVEIKVRDVDQQRAYRVLRQIQPSSNADDPDAEDSHIHCPQCHSDEIVFLELDRSTSPTDGERKFHWHCDACGHNWEDDGVEEN